MLERTSTNTIPQAIGYAVLATALFWLCAVCVTDEPAKVYPGLEPGMSPNGPNAAGQYQPRP